MCEDVIDGCFCDMGVEVFVCVLVEDMDGGVGSEHDRFLDGDADDGDKLLG